MTNQTMEQVVGTRGVSRASASAVMRQRVLAISVMLLPVLGSALALQLALSSGVSSLDLGLCLGMYLVSGFGVSLGFHRHFAHRAFKTSRTGQFVLAACGSMAAQGPLLFWTSVHRRHHAHSDRQGDPHSPNLHGTSLGQRLKGFMHSHLGWMLSDEVTSWPYYSRDLMRDEAIVSMHKQYSFWVIAGFAIPTVIGAVVTQTLHGALTALLWGGLVRMFILNQTSWCVGSLSHLYGSRPFATRDRSANNHLVALFTFGEGLQNNHHAFPSSAFHALRWWEPDLSGVVIRLLSRCGLIWEVKSPTQRAIHELASARATEHMRRPMSDDYPVSNLSKESNAGGAHHGQHE
jgi:stearoyl-CoA desaturase (Delta-9 desaturase)